MTISRRTMFAAPLAIIPLAASAAIPETSRRVMMRHGEGRVSIDDRKDIRARITARCKELGAGERTKKRIRAGLSVYLNVPTIGNINRSQLQQARAFIAAWPESGVVMRRAAEVALET